MKTIIKVGIGVFFLGVVIAELYQFTDTESSETLIMSIGMGIALLGLLIMITYAFWFACSENIFATAIASACILTIIFSIFVFFGALPIVPLDSRYAFGVVAIPALVLGGSTISISRISVRVKHKNGKVENREYEIRTKSTAFGDETTIERKK